jgi:phosphatidylglycerol:prolipoprotein diacylglycerol transferase
MTELLTMISVYLSQAAMTFPEWRPALLSLDFGFVGLGEFHLRWYALAAAEARLAVEKRAAAVAGGP